MNDTMREAVSKALGLPTADLEALRGLRESGGEAVRVQMREAVSKALGLSVANPEALRGLRNWDPEAARARVDNWDVAHAAPTDPAAVAAAGELGPTAFLVLESLKDRAPHGVAEIVNSISSFDPQDIRSCVDGLAAAGLVTVGGEAALPVVSLTTVGAQALADYRRMFDSALGALFPGAGVEATDLRRLAAFAAELKQARQTQAE